MRNKFFFIFTLVSLVVFAQLADSVKWELSYRNSIVNGGFEQGKQGFSATGNSTFRQITNSSLVGSGKASGYIDFTASSEKLRSDLFTIPNALKGRSCLAKFIYNGGGGADIRYWIENQSGTVVAGYGYSGSTNEVITSAASNYTDSRDINFTCPTSGSLRIVLEGQGNANALYVDDFYIGRPFTYIATDALGGSGNDFTYGDGAATNKRLTWNRGGSNPQVRWNESLSRLEYSNNGSSFSAIGSGIAGANYTNILSNYGFEDGTSGWAATGSASFTQSSTNPAFGVYKALVDFSAASEYFRSDATTIPQGLYGKNCFARFRYSGGGTADIYYRVTDGTNTLAGYTATSTSFKITSAASTWTDSLDLTFPCPSSGSVKLEFESAGNAASLSIDDTYIGENFKVGSVAQAELVGTWKTPTTANCAWSSTSGTMAAFSADTDCPAPTVSGGVTATATKLPAFKIANAKPGNYYIVANGNFRAVTATTECEFSLNDGTNTVGFANTYTGEADRQNVIPAYFTLASGQTDWTVNVFGKKVSGAGTCEISAQSNAFELNFQVYRFPLSSEVAVSANVPYQGGKATMVGKTSCAMTSSSGSWSNFTNDADCNDFTFTGGLTSCTNAKTPCAKAASLEAGKYLVIATGIYTSDTSTAGNFRISDGTNFGGASTFINSGTSAVYQGMLSAVFDYTSKQSNIEFNVQAIRTFAGSNLYVDNSSTNYTFEMHLIPLSPSVAMPNIVNSVKTPYNGSIKTVMASINWVAGTPTIQNQIGSWISSLTDVGTGEATINITSGVFSSTPLCTCSANGSGAGTNPRLCAVSESSATSSTLYGYYINAGSVTMDDSSGAIKIQCQGASN